MVPFRTTRSIILSSLNIKNILDINTVTGVFSSKSVYTNFGSGSATGTNSLAEGTLTKAIGGASHAEGELTKAVGGGSHAEGIGTQAIGIASHSEGQETIASGIYSHSEGSYNLSNNTNSHSEGNRTNAGGAASHTEGYGTSTGRKNYYVSYNDVTKVFTFSNANSSNFSGVTQGTILYGYDSDVLGDFFNIVVKQRSTVNGNITATDDNIGLPSNNGYLIDTNSGSFAHAEGDSTNASGAASHAEGAQTTAEGSASHAEGYNTKAIGNYSHAQGNNTIAFGLESNAEGELTKAHGDLSHAAGYSAEARHERTWIWKGSSDTNVLSTTRADQFLVSAAGGIYLANRVGIGTDNNQNALTVVGLISTDNNLTSNEWRSVWTTVSANSASWEESADILPTVTNYLSTNNVLMLSASIMGSLSVRGTIYSGATALVLAEYETLLGNGVNSSFTVTHNLDTDNIQAVIYDVGNNVVSYPTIKIVNSNSILVTFSFAPPLNYYRIVIFGSVPSNRINAYGQVNTIITTATGFGDIPILSGNWNSTYQTVSSLSALWSQGGLNAGTSSYTLTADNFIITQSSSWAVNTTSKSITGTLPSSPTNGMTVRFLDAAKTWGNTNRSLVIVRSGQPIESLSENLNCDISGYSFSLTYVGGTIGWRLY